LKKSYFYAGAQVLAQRDHTDPQDPNFFDQSFYVHDRLGSVRLVVVPRYDELTETWSVNAANAYTYTPFGGFYEGPTPSNSPASGTTPKSTSTTSAPACTTPP